MENTTPTQTPTPKAPRSAAQIEASRLNGAKSKGPVTEAGKATSSRNSQRHMVFASLITIKGEKTDDYEVLAAEQYETWLPADEHECNLVDTMTTCLWRRLRILAMESTAMDTQFERAGYPDNPDFIQTFSAFTSLSEENRAFERLHRYEARYLRTYERAARSLMAYRKFRQQPETAPTAPAPGPEPAPAPAPEPENKNERNEPEPHPHHPLTRRERRQLKWQKAHPKHVPNTNPRDKHR